MNWPARHPAAVIVIAAVAAVLSALAVSRLTADTSLQSLFPRDDRAATALVRVLDDFPSAEELLILVTTPDERPDPDRLIAFAGRLDREIHNDPQMSSLVSAFNYRTDAQSRQFVSQVLVPNAIFYLNDAEFAAAQQRLTRGQMAAQLHQDEAMLATPGPAAGGIAKAVMLDPLRLHEFLEQRLAGAVPFKTFQNSDAFLSPDGRSLLIRIAGSRPPSDLRFCHQITSRMTELSERVNPDHLQLEYSGAYAIAARSEESIRHDCIASVAGSVAMLAILFVVAFRRPLRQFAITFTPVALGALYGFGVYAMFDRSITPMTAVIGAILAGIGIDYSIFYTVNYFHFRDTRKTLSSIGGALVAAWVTSVVGFVAVGFASIPALRAFSIVGSLGLAGALLGAMLVLPALLVLLDRRGAVAGPRFSIRPLMVWIDHHAAGCLVVSTVLVLLAVGYLVKTGPFLELETDATIMHPRPNPPLDAEAHIAERMQAAPDSLIVYLHADSGSQLLSLAHEVSARPDTDAARQAGVASTFGLANLLPDPNRVAGRLAQFSPDRVLNDFDAAVAESSFNPEAFASYRTFLRTLLTPKRPPGIAELIAYDQLARTFLPRDAFAGHAPTEAITLIRLAHPLDTRDQRQACISQLRHSLDGVPGATLTGMSVLSLDSETTIHRDLPRLIVAAVVICALYLLAHFRSIKYATLAVLPSLCSLIILLAIAKLMGAKMNLVNMISIPLLIGIDIDYGIFLVSAARQSKSRQDLLDGASASGQAVILCAAATLLGVGSLAFTSVPAVRSLGWAVVIGVVSCAAAALFLLLPLLLRARRNIPSKSLAAVAMLLCAGMMNGCSAPGDRLSFPTEPMRVSGNTEWFDARHTGKPTFGIVHDTDGRVDRLLYDDSGNGHVDRAYRLSDYANERVPHLILLLDSIPFQTMLDRYSAGDFRWFDPPQKMIAPFPSLTEVCFSDVLHAPPLPGTIDQYFDPRDEETKGSLWDRVRGFEQPWERRLAYHADYLQQGYSFLDPDSWYAFELEKARQVLDQSPDRVTVIYIASAASLVCKYGKPGAETVLDGARQLCLQLLYERRGAIKITMMADHGHNYTPSKNVPLADILKDAGFHPTDKIRDDRDCVVEINALVTCAGVHTHQSAAVATALCRYEQVELTTYMDGPRVIIQSAKGRAAIECRNGSLRYLPLDGDVLDYTPLIARMKADGVMDADGFATDKAWFERTLDNPWPNVPRRVWDALHGRFITTPTVLISLKDGYYAGYPEYENYIKMASTHGGLNQANSATFAITMTGRLHGAVRHEDVIGTVEPGFEPRVQR